MVCDESMFVLTSPSHNDEIFIHMGDCEVLETVNSPVAGKFF